MTNKSKAILIFGPTASGKTSLAIQLAKKFNGEIINADSKQFYKSMPIITAMPSDDEFLEAPHHLFNSLDTDAEFSVAKYLKLAKKASDSIVSKGKTPIFVGGTGLYLNALEFGLSPIPSIEKSLFDDLNSKPVDALYQELISLDKASAESLESTDIQRIIRALSVVKQTGKSILDWQKMPNENMLDLDFIHLAINPDREVMYDRINRRAEKMIDLGVEDEVKNLLEQYGESKLNSLTSIGVDIFINASKNEITMQEATEKFAQKQRNYAKRQITWLRHKYPAEYIHEDINSTVKYLEEKIK